MQKIQVFFGDNRHFTYVILLLVTIAGLVTGHPTIAMWFGFMVAGFSAISNDSIQTLGTFLSSNRKVAWQWLWLFIGGIMVATVIYGWLNYSGDISFGRLNRIPQPQNVQFIQLLAPIFLIIFTRLRMPISTTFLLLATFSSTSTIHGMISKTVTGYVLAFVISIIAWSAIGYFTQRFQKLNPKPMTKKSHARWRVMLWMSTGFLWSAWLVQDNANAVVFLPRALSFTELCVALVIILIMLAYILRKRGGEIQSIVTEKTDVTNVRSASLINLVYGSILVYFKWINDLPMSTTWVFLGMLAGREIAITVISTRSVSNKRTFNLVAKDIAYAIVGLLASILLAYATKFFVSA